MNVGDEYRRDPSNIRNGENDLKRCRKPHNQDISNYITVWQYGVNNTSHCVLYFHHKKRKIKRKAA